MNLCRHLQVCFNIKSIIIESDIFKTPKDTNIQHTFIHNHTFENHSIKRYINKMFFVKVMFSSQENHLGFSVVFFIVYLTTHHPVCGIMAVIKQKFVVCSSSLHKIRHCLASTEVFSLDNLPVTAHMTGSHHNGL